jgi:hypothetical protein
MFGEIFLDVLKRMGRDRGSNYLVILAWHYDFTFLWFDKDLRRIEGDLIPCKLRSL